MALATFTLIRAGENIADAPASWWPPFVAFGPGAVCAAAGGAMGGAMQVPEEAEVRGIGVTATVDLDSVAEDERPVRRPGPYAPTPSDLGTRVR